MVEGYPAMGIEGWPVEITLQVLATQLLILYHRHTVCVLLEGRLSVLRLVNLGAAEPCAVLQIDSTPRDADES